MQPYSILLLVCLLLVLSASKATSSWKKLPSTGPSALLNTLTELSGPAHYYSFKEGSSQRILQVALAEGGRTLTMEIDLLCTNAERYEKIEVQTNVVFQLAEEAGGSNAYQLEIALNTYAKDHQFTVIFEPRVQLILYSKLMEAGGYNVLFQRAVDDGYLATYLVLLLLVTVVLKEVYRLRMRANNTYRVRIEAEEVALGWLLRHAFARSETYLPDFPPLLGNVFLLAVLLTLLVEFAYPLFSFSLSPKEKTLKYLVILAAALSSPSLLGLALALLLQLGCLFLLKEEGKKLGAGGSYIEWAYTVLVFCLSEYLLLSGSNALHFETSLPAAIGMLVLTVLELLYTYMKFTARILPFQRATLIRNQLASQLALLLGKNANTPAPEDAKVETSQTSARHELANQTEVEMRMDESL